MLAFRTFVVSASGLLHSPVVTDYLWSRDGNKAECMVSKITSVNHTPQRPYGSPPCERPPGPECACGFYAYPYPNVPAGRTSFIDPQKVVGLVSAYGRVIEHKDGVIRSEYVTVLALMMFGSFPYSYEEDDLGYYGFVSEPPPRMPPHELLERCAGLLGLPWGTFPTLEEGVAFLNGEASRYDEITLAAFSKTP